MYIYTQGYHDQIWSKLVYENRFNDVFVINKFTWLWKDDLIDVSSEFVFGDQGAVFTKLEQQELAFCNVIISQSLDF